MIENDDNGEGPEFARRPWSEEARACSARGDEEGEERAIASQLAVQKRDLRALLAMGDLMARRGDDRAATSFYRMALRVASSPAGFPPDCRAQLQQAQSFAQAAEARFTRSIQTQLHRYSLNKGAVSERVSHAIRLLLGEVPVQLQQPSMFYFPGLPQRAFFERSEFAWLPELEAQTGAIEQEVREIMAAGEAGFTPHTVYEPRTPPPATPLLNDPRWSAFHLWQRGRELRDHTARVPRTISALAVAPIPRISGFSPMIMFSLLQPGTHITPHYGSTNTRLICHLPIIVPDGCAIRVGNETRSWTRGEGLIFDDSFQHEAWNRGSGTRVILLFEIWRPDISNAERDELTALFEAIELSSFEDAIAA